ncbi:hypothetical protein R6L23_00090 [Streptomyces sp. SR27]|uniref:hypothetical protein n=1 Tax=Streptomyces sp. SR27 TaxID=3076630 RepID=UPI00295B5387|nr:hypothetical protein [Streptomyces sp. SR27]MDV9186659.1 hypothetical protein [Streptomyces sp. SR27]
MNARTTAAGTDNAAAWRQALFNVPDGGVQAVDRITKIPLAPWGVRYRPASAHDLLRRDLTVYGLGGLVLPFLGVKLIDLIVPAVPGPG